MSVVPSWVHLFGRWLCVVAPIDVAAVAGAGECGKAQHVTIIG